MGKLHFFTLYGLKNLILRFKDFSCVVTCIFPIIMFFPAVLQIMWISFLFPLWSQGNAAFLICFVSWVNSHIAKEVITNVIQTHLDRIKCLMCRFLMVYLKNRWDFLKHGLPGQCMCKNEVLYDLLACHCFVVFNSDWVMLKSNRYRTAAPHY